MVFAQLLIDQPWRRVIAKKRRLRRDRYPLWCHPLPVEPGRMLIDPQRARRRLVAAPPTKHACRTTRGTASCDNHTLLTRKETCNRGRVGRGPPGHDFVS